MEELGNEEAAALADGVLHLVHHLLAFHHLDRRRQNQQPHHLRHVDVDHDGRAHDAQQHHQHLVRPREEVGGEAVDEDGEVDRRQKRACAHQVHEEGRARAAEPEELLVRVRILVAVAQFVEPAPDGRSLLLLLPRLRHVARNVLSDELGGVGVVHELHVDVEQLVARVHHEPEQDQPHPQEDGELGFLVGDHHVQPRQDDQHHHNGPGLRLDLDQLFKLVGRALPEVRREPEGGVEGVEGLLEGGVEEAMPHHHVVANILRKGLVLGAHLHLQHLRQRLALLAGLDAEDLVLLPLATDA
mmetsp:Transcript_56223/g.114973  ORF Transcript_56223/g.114973 Transcript_56223/m.114973 type:complete len:300 (-) Transcript_56223:865-1764(-)